MKKMFTRLCIVVLGVCMTMALHSQTELIWGGPDDPNGSFDGGLNDWTTEGISSSVPDSAENAVWVWDAEGDASEGAYWGTRGPIQSESVDNGAAVFNSDFLDNNGIEGNFGAGPAPSPQVGVLTSPTIDCSEFSSVAVYFSQFYRAFGTDLPNTFVEVSNDGGNSWTSFEVNPDVSSNTSTEPTSEKRVNVSDVAAGEEDVQIRFTWDGDYYFWIVDDVALRTLPANDLAATSITYPAENFRAPKPLDNCDTMEFSMAIVNNGARMQTNVELSATVEDDSGNEVFSTTEAVGNYAPGGPDTFDFESVFVPTELDTGVYTITYEVSSDTTDITPDNNVIVTNYISTPNMFSKDVNGPTGHFRSTTPSEIWTSTNLYEICGINYEDDMDNDIIKEVHWSFATVAEDSLDLTEEGVQVFVARLHGCDIDAFDASIPDPYDHPNLTILGNNEFSSLDTFPQNSYIATTVFNYPKLINEGVLQEGAPIDPDSCYIAGVRLNGLIYVGHSDAVPYDPNLVTTLNATTQWFPGFGGGELGAAIRVMTDSLVPVDAYTPTLPETAVELYPNPVRSNQLTLDFSLESAQDVNIRIADVMGRTIQQHTLDKVTNDKWTTDVDKVQAGTYFLHIVAEDGERTIKFIKQ